MSSIIASVLQLTEGQLFDEYAALDALTALLLDSQSSSIHTINYDSLFRNANLSQRTILARSSSTDPESSSGTPTTKEIVALVLRHLGALPLARIEPILLQLCTIAVFAEPGNQNVQINEASSSNALAKLLVDFSTKSIHIAFKVLTTLQSLMPFNLPAGNNIAGGAPTASKAGQAAAPSNSTTSSRIRIQQLIEMVELYAVQSCVVPPPADPAQPSGDPPDDQRLLEDKMKQTRTKQRQSDYLFGLQDLVSHLVDLGRRLEAIPAASLDARRSLLRQELKSLNGRLQFPIPAPPSPTLRPGPSSPARSQSVRVSRRAVPPLAEGIHFPLRLVEDAHHAIIKFIDGEAALLKSATRAPFLIYFESASLTTDDCAPNKLPPGGAVLCGDPALASRTQVYKERLTRDHSQCTNPLCKFKGKPFSPRKRSQESILAVAGAFSAVPTPPLPTSPPQPSAVNESLQTPSLSSSAPEQSYIVVESPATSLTPATPPTTPAGPLGDVKLIPNHMWHHPIQLERHAEKERRLRDASPFAARFGLDNWSLECLIVKFGLDALQEQLALQMLDIFAKGFAEAKLPIRLTHYSVAAVGNDVCFVQPVLDATSIHHIKKLNNNIPLAAYFHKRFRASAQSHREAQRIFVESLAGYSLFSYFMLVKDRNNGNLLIGTDGSLVHIDFGFMLWNTPGEMNFESAPFKMTQEFVQVIGGVDSPMYRYFKVLMHRGFVVARKLYPMLASLLRPLLHLARFQSQKLPCLAAGDSHVLSLLEDRFVLAVPENKIAEHVEGLISAALADVTTTHYDQIQYWSQGTLY